jgi:hypothetical protein
MPNHNQPERKGNAAQTAKPGKNARTPKLPPFVRGLFIVLSWLVFPVLCIAALYVGLRVGYVKFGGGDPDDVLHWETWKHMLDLVFKDT